MNSNLILAALLLGALLTGAVTWALLLRAGLRWAKVAEVSKKKLLVATLIWLGIERSLQVVLLAIGTNISDSQELVLDTIWFVVFATVPWLLISRVFRIGKLRSIKAWLPTILSPLVGLCLIMFVIRPWVAGAFISRGNNMAPTILGKHQQSFCPVCSRPNYRLASNHPGILMTAICENFHTTEIENDLKEDIREGDHVIIMKVIEPKRWDIVAYHTSDEPQVLRLSRLVGLPGEKVHIQDGLVWINSQPQTPPERLDGIEYLSEMPERKGMKMCCSAAAAASLGADEYFVLGDFSAQSIDSRLWTYGDDGHPPYALPASNLEGVVTHTYWPFSRWRVHR